MVADCLGQSFHATLVQDNDTIVTDKMQTMNWSNRELQMATGCVQCPCNLCLLSRSFVAWMLLVINRECSCVPVLPRLMQQVSRCIASSFVDLVSVRVPKRACVTSLMHICSTHTALNSAAPQLYMWVHASNRFGMSSFTAVPVRCTYKGGSNKATSFPLCTHH